MDVTPDWEIKLRMVTQHRSQYLPGPEYGEEQVAEPLDQYGLVRLTRVMDEFFGIQCWTRYAEANHWWKAADRLVPRRLPP